MSGPARDPLAAIVDYNRRFVGGGRNPAWLRAKLDRLCASPFGFFRGTFHLFVADWASLGDDALAPRAPQPIVGDLHLENFGAYRPAAGGVVFDVNDFDESGDASPALDLARLATSIVLADAKHSTARAADRIGALVDAWLAAAASLDLRPLGAADLPEAVRSLLAAADDASRSHWIDKRVESVGDERRFRTSDKYQRVTDPALRVAVIEGVREFAASSADRPDRAGWPQVFDVADRLAGTGSLGRFRWTALIEGKSARAGRERILELKEALPSSLAPAEDDPARRVVGAQRLLQGAVPAFLGVAHVAGRAFTVRELQPTEAKIDTATVRGSDLDALCAACGSALGRLHRRGDRELAARFAGRERSVGRLTLAFALRYAERVEADHAALRAQRAAVERALAIAPATTA